MQIIDVIKTKDQVLALYLEKTSSINPSSTVKLMNTPYDQIPILTQDCILAE